MDSDSPISSSDSSAPSPSQVSRARRGRWTVIGMFVFGMTVVVGLWVYWEVYTLPFRPLRDSLSVEFPTSRPYVTGGREKQHLLEYPNTLRVVMRLADDDLVDDAEFDRRALRIYQIAKRDFDLTPYSEFEVHLVQQVHEQTPRRWTKMMSPQEWEALEGQNQETAP